MVVAFFLFLGDQTIVKLINLCCHRQIIYINLYIFTQR